MILFESAGEESVSQQQLAYTQKRRSTRIEQAVPLVVQGVGALREPYQEQVSTVSISCHGCTYVSKHEVIQGETVFLDIQSPNHGSVGSSTRARVRWAQKYGAKDRAFQIAVELETAGNVWGLTAPPADWFPPQIPEATDPASLARELKVVPRKEQPAIHVPEAESNPTARLTRNDAALPAIPPIAQIMFSLGEQIQTMAAEAAASAVIREKNRLFDEFRTQLREEAVKAVQSAMSTSREVISRQALQEVGAAHEAAARNSHSQWRKRIEQDMDSAQQHMLKQGKEFNQRLDAVAARTVDHVQSKLEATRSEAVERFVSRIRDQVSPLLEEAKDALRKLEGAETALRKESEAIFAGMENQLAYSTNVILAKSQEDLEKNGADITTRAHESMLKLSQEMEKATQDHLNSLLSTAESQIAKILQEKATDVSREFSTGIEGNTRSYLESISKLLSEIPQKAVGNGHN
jgi:gas vesicle protein